MAVCIFSHAVESVSNTRIFARDSTSPLQFLVYEMQFSAAEDLAMILPIPVPRLTPEKAVRFINLEKFPDFFAALEKGFPKPPSKSASLGGRGGEKLAAPPKLAVVDVGSFEASFVPTIADFARLDERFRLPAGTWDKLPAYKAYGFAVFKLKKEHKKTHPMAFEFPRANPRQLFFPTVHIHDGVVHPKADFDHTLYAQFGMGHFAGPSWIESPQPAGMFMDIAKSQGLIDKNGHAYKRVIRGERKNEDTIA
jgi:hypothetical protein